MKKHKKVGYKHVTHAENSIILIFKGKSSYCTE